MSTTEFIRRFGWLEERLGDRWYVVYLDGDTMSVSYDVTRLSGSGAQTYVWTRWDYRRPQRAEGFRFVFYIERRRVDCAALASAAYSFTAYGEGGQVVQSDSHAYPEMRPSVPGSVGDAILEAICENLQQVPDS
jgi:hypothetical protein